MDETVTMDISPKINIDKFENPVVEPDSDIIPEQEDIEKPILHKEWKFEATYIFDMRGESKEEIFNKTYIQKPLSYLAFGEFTGLVSRKLAEAMRGPEGLSIDRLFPGDASPLIFKDGKISLVDTNTDMIDPIVQGIAVLASYVPEFIAEAQCIWLRVPRHERALLVDIWARPVDEGGMTVDQGEEMLNIFIEQNYDELDGFLNRSVRVKNTVQKMRKRNHKNE